MHYLLIILSIIMLSQSVFPWFNYEPQLQAEIQQQSMQALQPMKKWSFEEGPWLQDAALRA